MTPSDVLVPGALAILFVVAWFVFGLIYLTLPDRPKGRTGTRNRHLGLPGRRPRADGNRVPPLHPAVTPPRN